MRIGKILIPKFRETPTTAEFLPTISASFVHKTDGQDSQLTADFVDESKHPYPPRE